MGTASASTSAAVAVFGRGRSCGKASSSRRVRCCCLSLPSPPVRGRGGGVRAWLHDSSAIRSPIRSSAVVSTYGPGVKWKEVWGLAAPDGAEENRRIVKAAGASSRITAASLPPDDAADEDNDDVHGDPLPPTAVTFSANISTDLPLYESPGASIDVYLEDRNRIFEVIFPDRRRSHRLNDEEWRIRMLPIRFLFASVNPVVVMRLRCKSRGKGYSPGVTLHAPRVLELRATRWELQGLDSAHMPSHFALDVRGSLYPDREVGGASLRLRGHLEMSISLVPPAVLALVPGDVLRAVAEEVLKRLLGRMKQEVDDSLLEDFQRFRREKLKEQQQQQRQDKRKRLLRQQPASPTTAPSEPQEGNHRPDEPYLRS